MTNEINPKENNNKVKILKRIGLAIVLAGIYTSMCVLFFVYSKFDDAKGDLFISSVICFLLGFPYVMSPVQFFEIFYKFGAWLISKSAVWDEPVSQKKTHKPFKITFTVILSLSYILLGVSIIINIL